MPTSPRRSPAPVAIGFDPDPQHLLPPIGVQKGPAATQRFRVQRSRDLVNLQVSAYGCELVTADGTTVLRPVAARARIEVRLPFQHLGEQSFADEEGSPPPPVRARAAYGTRLVFSVPTGEQIDYSVEGVLTALSRLPLIVVPLAQPAAVDRGLLDQVPIAVLTGGLSLFRGKDGLVLANTPQGTALATGDGVVGVLLTALGLGLARQILARESATDLARVKVPDWAGLLVQGPVFRPASSAPRAPRTDETAIEAPYRLLLSPSSAAGFAHATLPVEASGGRVELWHSRLGVRTADGGVDELSAAQRIVRAVWNRDRDLGENAHDTVPFRMSLDSRDRTVLVTQTSDPKARFAPRPVDAHKLYLSALGAYLDLHGHWPQEHGISPEIESWDHIAPMGRDQFVKVVSPGYLFPFGHSAALVKQTVRRVDLTGGPVARLHTEFFLVVTEPVRSYQQHDLPFVEIRIRPLVTPDLLDPNLHGVDGLGQMLFWPMLSSDGSRLPFALECLDRDGRRIRLHTPLLFVGERIDEQKPPKKGQKFVVTLPPAAQVISTWESLEQVDGQGQHIAFAPSATPGETSVETRFLQFTGTPQSSPNLDAVPRLVDAEVILPAVQRLGPPGAATSTTVTYPAEYLADGYTGSNAVLEQFLSVTSPVGVDFSQSSDRAGGFLAPNLSIQAVTRKQGAVGDPAGYTAGGFNAKDALKGLVPKLFGLFDLTDLLDAIGVFDHAPKFLTSALDQIAALLQDLESLQQGLEQAASRLAADAVSAPTKGMQDAAKAAAAALGPQTAAVSAAAAAVVSAVTGLQQPAVPSSPADVTAAISGHVTDLIAALDGLTAALTGAVLPTATRAAVEGPLHAVQGVLKDAGALFTAVSSFVQGLTQGGLTQRASYTWQTPLVNWPTGKPAAGALFVAQQEGKPQSHLGLTVQAHPAGAQSGVDVTAELTDFALNLFPDTSLVALVFDRLAFRAGTGRKADVDVSFEGIQFQGVLGFVNTLKELIPFDGFSDPPYLDVDSSGLRAGFDLALPSVGVGVFSLENISLHAGVDVPFLGDALTVGFSFCTRDKPFRLTVMMIGGGGFVGLTLSPKGLVVLEMSLEAGACLSIDLGVASGSVSIMVGVYLKLEGQGGSLTGYFRVRGEVDVLGLISASITLELSLTYDFGSGKLIGRASIDIEVEVFLISFSVSVSCERKLAGSNGDPTYAALLDVDPTAGTAPAWDAYCAAFAAD